MSSKTESVKMKKGIVAVSIVIPLAVAALFGIKIPNLGPFYFLPPIYASINGFTAILLVLSLYFIKSGKIEAHKKVNVLAMFCSLLFLLMYVFYHMTSESTSYGGEGMARGIYFFILISHIVLSVVVIPFVLITFSRAWFGQFEQHKKIARIAYPLWLYVAVSGVVVYLMISPYYGA